MSGKRTGKIRVHSSTFDVAAAAETAANADGFATIVVEQVEAAWAAGADVVLLPEFLWLGLEKYGEKMSEIAAQALPDRFPQLQRLLRADKLAVLGTCPMTVAPGIMHNVCFIANSGTWHFQSKLVLTPWERDFTGGRGIRPFFFLGAHIAVLVCLDSEIPEHSVALRQLSPPLDLLLVPSATETMLGVERIGRCSSARAVELGCVVTTSHLVGNFAHSSLVDENVGRAGVYFPSQHSFKLAPREDLSPVVATGTVSTEFTLDLALLDRMRRLTAETNPALLVPSVPTLVIRQQ
jgi:predicted amidohydrolase